MFEHIAATPQFSTFVLASVAALLSAAAPLVAALLRAAACRRAASALDAGRPAPAVSVWRWPELLCAAALLAVPVLFAAAMRESRATMLPAFFAADPAQRATLIAAGFAVQLNTLALLAYAMIPPWLVGLPLIGLATAYRARLRGLQRAATAEEPPVAAAWRACPGPSPAIAALLALAPVLLVLIPLLAGINGYVLSLMQGFASIAVVESGSKAELLLAIFADAAGRLSRGTAVAAVGLALSAALAVLALVVFSPARRRQKLAPGAERRQLQGPPAAAETAIGAGLCLLAAAALLLVALPHRAENRSPLPVQSQAPLLPAEPFATPRLAGPDPLQHGLVLQVDARRALLEGAEVEPRTIGELLALQRDRRLARPGATPARQLALLCAPQTPAARVMPLLRAAHAAGVAELTFVFVHEQAFERPLLGRLTSKRGSGARVQLSAARAAGQLVPAPQTGCERLAAEVVRQRQAGQLPSLFVGEPAPGD